jgi:tryptophan synthase alpha chain
MERMQNSGLRNPRVIGFGIKNKADFQRACSYAQGAIIGSSFVQSLEAEGAIERKVQDFIQTIVK